MQMSDKVNSWDAFFLESAKLQASKSKDPSTKVGCVVVDDDNVIRSTGFNGFARGIDETIPERWERPIKYKYVCHAEANAVYNAARSGISLKGTRIYLNWAGAPCDGCANAIIQAGIKEVITTDISFPGKGNGVSYSTDLGAELLKERGILIKEIPSEK
jgi:dCMP deaminase